MRIAAGAVGVGVPSSSEPLSLLLISAATSAAAKAITTPAMMPASTTRRQASGPPSSNRQRGGRSGGGARTTLLLFALLHQALRDARKRLVGEDDVVAGVELLQLRELLVAGGDRVGRVV